MWIASGQACRRALLPVVCRESGDVSVNLLAGSLGSGTFARHFRFRGNVT